MFRCFFPDEYLESAYAVNYVQLYKEGVRGLLFEEIQIVSKRYLERIVLCYYRKEEGTL